MHVRSCRKWFPTDKKIAGGGKSVDLRYYFYTYFMQDIDYGVIFFASMFWWVTIVKLRNSFKMSTDIQSKKK